MPQRPYGLICPINKACEVLQPRWTIQILSELWRGSTRFNDLRRGLPGISPALLSRRLKELEALGLVERIEDRGRGTVDYLRTKRAEELDPVLNGLAAWAQRHIEADAALLDTDAGELMWTLHHKIDLAEMPARRNVLRFHFEDGPPEKRVYWLIAQPGSVEICYENPGFDVDLFVEAQVAALAAIYTGRSTYAREIDAGRLFLSGDPRLVRTIDRWLKKSDYADVEGVRMVV